MRSLKLLMLTVQNNDFCKNRLAFKDVVTLVKHLVYILPVFTSFIITTTLGDRC